LISHFKSWPTLSGITPEASFKAALTFGNFHFYQWSHPIAQGAWVGPKIISTSHQGS